MNIRVVMQSRVNIEEVIWMVKAAAYAEENKQPLVAEKILANLAKEIAEKLLKKD